MKRVVSFATACVAVLAAVGAAGGAAPDGAAGPWADFVVASHQGPVPNGFLPGRSDPQNAVGPAESPPGNDDPIPDNTFFSLGFGGFITLGFDNPICNTTGADFDIDVVEITKERYPDEVADVYVSSDGSTFVLAGQIAKDGSVALPAGITSARYVKLVDRSNPALFPLSLDPQPDGFDVDGVRARDTTSCERLGAQGCTPGYWKQPHHVDSWPVGIKPTDLFGPTFLGTPTFAALTLDEVLGQGGGGANALGRHAVAALLNALSPNVDYPYTSAQVKQLVFAALSSGNAKTIETAKDLLEKANQRGCPLS